MNFSNKNSVSFIGFNISYNRNRNIQRPIQFSKQKSHFHVFVKTERNKNISVLLLVYRFYGQFQNTDINYSIICFVR